MQSPAGTFCSMVSASHLSSASSTASKPKQILASVLIHHLNGMTTVFNSMYPASQNVKIIHSLRLILPASDAHNHIIRLYGNDTPTSPGFESLCCPTRSGNSRRGLFQTGKTSSSMSVKNVPYVNNAVGSSSPPYFGATLISNHYRPDETLTRTNITT